MTDPAPVTGIDERLRRLVYRTPTGSTEIQQDHPVLVADRVQYRPATVLSQSGLCQRDRGTRFLSIGPDQGADHLYDTCAGFFGHDGIASLAAALGTAFSESLCGAMVTTFRKKMSDPYAALLFRGLLQDGYSLGRIASELDAYQASEYGELPSFIVLGDAAFRMPPANAAEASRVTLVDSTGSGRSTTGEPTPCGSASARPPIPIRRSRAAPAASARW